MNSLEEPEWVRWGRQKLELWHHLVRRFSLVMLVVGCFAGAASFVLEKENLNLGDLIPQRYDAQTTAHVLATRESPGERGKCTIWYEFTVDGTTYKGPTNSRVRLYQPCSYFEGRDIPVVYQSSDPTQNEWKADGESSSALGYVAGTVLLVGVAAVVGSAGTIWRIVRRSKYADPGQDPGPDTGPDTGQAQHPGSGEPA